MGTTNTVKLWMVSAALAVALIACQLEEEKKETAPEYSTVKVLPEQDSLFMNENNETKQLSLVGAIVNITEKTITNSGVMTDIKYTVRTVDTVFQTVSPSSARWYSSNTAVATVNNGLVVSKNPGYTEVSASIGSAYSKPVVVNVRPVNKAPGLTLYPPDVVFIMQNYVDVAGLVQQNSALSVDEPNSGFNIPFVLYNADGTFKVTVTGLNEGLRTITVRASNPNDLSLYTERVKKVLYYPPFSLGADAIVGNWLGTTLGKDFHFAISKSTLIPFRYDITGTIDIDFKSLGLGLGFVKDINLVGFLDHNGSIKVALSKDTQGFHISGEFTGHFSSTGTGKGTYRAEAVRSGWPKISFNDVWSAVKVP
jgi:hypothetical protein